MSKKVSGRITGPAQPQAVPRDDPRFTSSKHTPGPWDVVDAQEDGPGIFHIVTEHDARVAYTEVYSAHAEADARLIAAAPDLYEAARKALDILPPGPVKDELIDAVLKAEGRE